MINHLTDQLTKLIDIPTKETFTSFIKGVNKACLSIYGLIGCYKPSYV